MVKTEKVYLITYSTDSIRKGQPADILGIKSISSNNIKRLFYYVVYEDGQVDYIDKEFADNNYKFVTLDDMLRYGTP